MHIDTLIKSLSTVEQVIKNDMWPDPHAKRVAYSIRETLLDELSEQVTRETEPLDYKTSYSAALIP